MSLGVAIELEQQQIVVAAGVEGGCVAVTVVAAQLSVAVAGPVAVAEEINVEFAAS